MLYVDSEGDAELHFRISDHLGMCSACAEWFAGQQRFEQALTERLARGSATPELWERVLRRAGIPGRTATRRRWHALGVALAALALLAVGFLLRTASHAHAHDLPLAAAQWHTQLLQGGVQPDLVSTSDQEVDHYLKKKVPFRVHCPPRMEANFAVKGAGVCTLKDHQQAAYIVGDVGPARVSILVLERAALHEFPLENTYLRGGKRHRCNEGKYQMVSGIIADNVVVVIGAARTDELDALLNAYGSYHDG
jgi:anti-sigma factor RsiW